jgi:predicted HNH restriction endonuclease
MQSVGWRYFKRAYKNAIASIELQIDFRIQTNTVLKDQVNARRVIKQLKARTMQSSAAHNGLSDFPGEVPEATPLVDGAVQTVTVNRYERDLRARRQRIKHYGANCKVCDIDLVESYRELGRGFIDVHYLVPLASLGDEYIVDPVSLSDSIRPLRDVPCRRKRMCSI